MKLSSSREHVQYFHHKIHLPCTFMGWNRVPPHSKPMFSCSQGSTLKETFCCKGWKRKRKVSEASVVRVSENSVPH